MSGHSHTRRLVAIVIAALGVFAAACAEKVSAPQVVGSPRFTIQLTATATRTAVAQKLFVIAVYFSSPVPNQNDSSHILDTATAAITGGPQQITLKIDLTTCLSDQTRRGSRDACSVYIGAFLEPTTFNAAASDFNGIAYDYQVLGPFDATPGHPPAPPAIDLSTSRFAVNHWEADEALRLGGDQTPQSINGPITGFGSGPTSNAPTLFAVTGGAQDQGGTNALGEAHFQIVAQLAVFQNGAWRRVNGPPNIGFNDVAAFAANDVYIAGTDGLYHYDGTAITAVSAVREQISTVAVTGSSARAKYLVAGTLTGSVWISNTSTYTKYSTITSQSIDEVCVTGPSEAFAASRSAGGLFRFDGTNWSSVPSTFTQGKNDLQCLGPGQAYVATQGAPGVLLRWNGTGWTQVPNPAAISGRAMNWAVVSPNEIYAVGDSANTNRAFYRFDGSAWREIGRVGFTGAIKTRPWADPRGGAAYVASSGSSGPTRLEMMSAAGTSVLSYQPSMRDVIMPSATSAFAVGANFFLARWNGTRWSVDAPPTGTGTNLMLQGVWADGPSNAWAAGQSTIVRWDGARWNVVSDGRHPIVLPADNYNAVWGAGGSVWMAGDASILRCKSATACATDAVTGSGALYGIWGTSPTNAFAVGAAGRIVHFDGSSWTPMASPTGGRLLRLWGTGPVDVWAVGDTVVLHYDGNAWKLATPSQIPSHPGSSSQTGQSSFQVGVWGASAGEIYFGTWYWRILRGAGGDWGEMTGPFQFGVGRIVGMAGAASGCAIAVTDGNTSSGGPILLRGVGPTGCLSTPMTGPSSWP